MKQWDKIFRKEGKHYSSHLDYIDEIKKIFKRHNVKRILDLGCGAGNHLIHLAKSGFEMYGIDISKEAIKITKQELKENNLNAKLKVGHIYEKLPYEDNFFDAIISIRVIHHANIKQIRNLIGEIERILKHNGLIFITVRKRISKKKMTKSKWIDNRTYIPLEGKEKGVTHYLFNKNILRKEFRNFKIHTIWIEPRNEEEKKKRKSWESYYCLLAEKQS